MYVLGYLTVVAKTILSHLAHVQTWVMRKVSQFKYVLPHPASTNFLIILLHIKKGIGENGKYSNGRTVTVGDGYNANSGRTFKSLKAVKLSIINNGYRR